MLKITVRLRNKCGTSGILGIRNISVSLEKSHSSCRVHPESEDYPEVMHFSWCTTHAGPRFASVSCSKGRTFNYQK